MNPGHLRTGDLAARQAALVEALVAGGPDPAGFDVARLASTRTALLRKRAGETAKLWPLLAASHGNRWQATFAAHAAGREGVGALRDGWDLARALRTAGALPGSAADELAEREAGWRYDGASPPGRRRCARLKALAGNVLGRLRG
ncbi:MAG: hypothetical protein JWP64_5400 [Pseudonocardia sp.]|jgi:hypothetical protein|uniref:hypothetical protein n=1 Tax=Pseudonocardia sp. TaxID=60912 RepID=UPI00262713F0|nr:hypothetical protein [Pseudonocardia sp.]MCU1630451.1 hypothetical protein [Pseudonocardia sp.]